MCRHVLNAQVSIRFPDGNWYDCPECYLDAPRAGNAHVVVTRNVVRCARLAGVRSLCFTSSGGAVTSPWVRTPQLRVPWRLAICRIVPRRPARLARASLACSASATGSADVSAESDRT